MSAAASTLRSGLRPADEAERLGALRELHILDTPDEERFDRITRLIARLFAVPIAYVSMIDESRQWFKSRVGVPMRETIRDISFCGHAILQDETLVVSDAQLDERFATNPHVAGEPFIRFYAGHPLRSPDRYKVGTLCMMDLQPRNFSVEEYELFEQLADIVERELTLTELIGYQQDTLRVKEELIESQRDLARLYAELEIERGKSDDLLLNILPASVAMELKVRGEVEAVKYPSATVMFTDFVSFTRLSESLSPEELVAELHECFTAFDRIVARHGVEKMKTIGDGYMCVAGIPNRSTRHARDMLCAALEIRDFIADRAVSKGHACLGIRIGLHSGPVVAGVVGLNKFAYDIWGDTVNVASRVESAGANGRVNISRATRDLVSAEFACEPRGSVEVRNHEAIEMFFVERAREG